MLWELAYSEVHVTKTYWPDYRREHLYEAIREYQPRERRFDLDRRPTQECDLRK
jgi:undecaprenyl diphosphate synthase